MKGNGRPADLLREPDFLRLWAGETISDLGDQITLLALPLTAVITLHATPADMGFLGAAGTAPAALVSLVAGVWVDRLPRRPILIVSDIGRAVALATVPIAFVLGVLSMTQLYLVAFVVGTLSVFFVIAYQSYLPSLVGRERLVDANGKMSASSSISQVAGPGLAGVLVQLFIAPMPIVLDSLSFLASVLGLAMIRRQETRPPVVARRPLVQEIREGLVTVVRHPFLRTLLSCGSLLMLCYTAQLSIFVLFMTRELGLAPTQIGVLLAVGSAGAIVGAIIAAPVARWMGMGPSFVCGAALIVVGCLARGLATGEAPLAMTTLALAQATFSIGWVGWSVNGPALRQAIVPGRLLGRVNATWRFAVWGAGPIGAILGGTLGEFVGLRAAMLIAGLGSLVPFALLLSSSLAGGREVVPIAEPDAAQ